MMEREWKQMEKTRENKSSRVETGGGGKGRGDGGVGVRQRWKNYSHRTCSQKVKQSERPSFRSNHGFAQLQNESPNRTELKAATPSRRKLSRI